MQLKIFMAGAEEQRKGGAAQASRGRAGGAGVSGGAGSGGAREQVHDVGNQELRQTRETGGCLGNMRLGKRALKERQKKKGRSGHSQQRFLFQIKGQKRKNLLPPSLPLQLDLDKTVTLSPECGKGAGGKMTNW